MGALFVVQVLVPLVVKYYEKQKTIVFNKKFVVKRELKNFIQNDTTLGTR